MIEGICLRCVLDDCNDRSPRCLYKIFLRDEKVQKVEAAKVERHLAQLAQARLTQRLKRAGRKGYQKGLKKYIERRQKLAALGMKRYDKRSTRHL